MLNFIRICKVRKKSFRDKIIKIYIINSIPNIIDNIILYVCIIDIRCIR